MREPCRPQPYTRAHTCVCTHTTTVNPCGHTHACVHTQPCRPQPRTHAYTCTHTRTRTTTVHLRGHTLACVHTYTHSHADAQRGRTLECTLVPPHLLTVPLEVVANSHVSVWLVSWAGRQQSSTHVHHPQVGLTTGLLFSP